VPLFCNITDFLPLNNVGQFVRTWEKYFAYPAAGTLLHLDPPQTTSWNSIVSGVKWWVFMPGKPVCIYVEVENKMEKFNYFFKREISATARYLCGLNTYSTIHLQK
jgi:hypothetical protein